MFQLVDSLDGNSSGGTHLVNLNTGVRVVVQNQLGCPFHGLCHHAHAVFGIDTHFNAGLHGCLDILKHVGDAAGSHGSGCRNLFFGNEHGESHLVENVQHQLLLLLGGIAAGDECHAFHLADGGIGNKTEHGHFFVCYIVCQLFKRNAGCNGYKNLCAF